MRENNVVYLHVKKGTDDVFYVGIGSKRRAYSTQECKRNKVWCNYYKKYGRDVRIINEGLSYDDARFIEDELIATFGRRGIDKEGQLANRMFGDVPSFKGLSHSKETRQKMSDSAKNRESRNIKIIWNGKEYKSMRECARVEQLPFSTVQKYVNWDQKPNCYRTT